MPLVDLPDEILLEIIRLTLKGDEYGAEDVQQLATTCKRIKRVCDAVLWSKYTLVIRLPSTRYLHAPRIGSNLSSREWWAVFRTRIAHLLSKACVVRHLTVVDSVASHWGCDTALGVPRCPLFASEVMDAAVPAIAACSSLTTLRLRSGSVDVSAQWPDRIWPLIQRGLPSLDVLELGASFTNLPALQGPPIKLGCLGLRWCSGLIDDFLQQNMLMVSHLKITFVESEAAPAPEGGCFVPTGQFARHLRTLQVEIPFSRIPDLGDAALFDVSNIPHAQIFVKIIFNRTAGQPVPYAWWDIQKRIDGLISGGVRAYEVIEVIKANDCAYVWRPPVIGHPVYRPRHQDRASADFVVREAMESRYRQFQALC